MKVTFGDLAVNDSPFVLSLGDVQLEGARMTSQGIEAGELSEERLQVDTVAIGFVEKSNLHLGPNTVDLPLYLTSNKEVMLFRMKVPVVGEKHDVILSGSSFFVQ